MYRLEKTFNFEAAHHLPNHDGKCKRLHGHSFSMILVCSGPDLSPVGPKKGMLVDYGDVKREGDRIVGAYLDHHYLNETLAQFGITDPTSEHLARWVYETLKPYLPLLAEVRIGETCTSFCTYSPDFDYSSIKSGCGQTDGGMT